MTKTKLIGLFARAAIVAGILRAIAAFVPLSTPEGPRQALYLLIDIFILFGVLGLYGNHYERIGKLGLNGFAIAIVGLLAIRSSRAFPGMDLYAIGALVFSAGLIVLGMALTRARLLQVWIVSSWALSLGLGVLAAALNSAPLSIAAGLCFALGFFGAGVQLRGAISR